MDHSQRPPWRPALGQAGQLNVVWLIANGSHIKWKARMAIFRGEDVIDEWSAIVPNCSEYAGAYLRGVMKRIDEMQLPIQHKEEKAATGLLKSVTGGSRAVVSINPTSKALNRVTILLYAFPIGTTVTIGWYALSEGSGFGKGPGFRMPFVNDMDLFDRADLQALVTSVHTFAVLPAAEALFDKGQVTLTKLTRATSGMFGIAA